MSPPRPHESGRNWALAIGAVLVIDILFGGATRPDSASSAVARLASLPLLVAALWRLPSARSGRIAWTGVALLGTIAASPLVQSLPLPPSVWTALPGRDFVSRSYRATGTPLPWLPLSLTPYETQDVLLWLIPPAAMLIACLTLGERWRRSLALVIPTLAVASVVLGVMQVLGGPDSRLRFYSITNIDSSVGFFANRNHQAALLVSGLALASLWLPGRGARRSHAAFGLFAAPASLLLLVVGLAATRSRAGVVIGAFVLLGGALLSLAGGARDRSGRLAVLAVAASAVTGLGLALAFLREPLLARFREPLNADLRLQSGPAIRRAVADFFPVGAGLGSFDPVYQRVEPLAAVSPAFLNHAHNDLLEVLLETGLAGAVVLVAFVVWGALATFNAFQRREEAGGRIPLFASLVVLALLAHSLVDYPLRTTSLSCVFALACGLLAGREGRAEAGERSRADSRGLSKGRETRPPATSRPVRARSDA